MSEVLERHHAGGKNTFPMARGVVGAALFRGQRQEHRIWLSRDWGALFGDGRYALWCGMNPSTAGADVDDLTVRKEQHFTKLLGLRKMFKVNVGSYCCTDPAALPRDAVLSHPDNLPTIMDLAAGAHVIIMATGFPPDPLIPLAREVFDHLQRAGHKMLCLGQTLGGWPKHTSRLGYATPFREFRL